MTTCTVEGCERTHHARGWCPPHYKRWAKYGDPCGTRPHTQPGATRRQAEVACQRREERFEDARHLIAGGVHPDWIPARLGCTREALAIQARRHKALDIYEWAKPQRASTEKPKPCPDLSLIHI